MDFPTSTPSAEGVDARGIAAFVDAVDADPRVEPHGLIVQRHGRRIAEGYWAPHRAGTSRLVYSVSKTFTGTALAVLLGEGRLSLDDLVADHLPELFEGADERTRRMRIRHIASMSSGHDREMWGEALAADPDDPLRAFFRATPEHEPGTWFVYNQPPVLALATILQRLAGRRLVDVLGPAVLDPLGITGLRWAQHRPGVDMGFSGVHTHLDAVARLGQLHLDDGVWDGRRLLPEGWVAQASAVQIPNPQRDEPDWQQGYGFQLWRSRHGYRGDGAFGQYMVVLPEQDVVVAMFSCTEDMQGVLDALWTHLLPACSPAATPSAAADDALAERLAALRLPTAAERRRGGPAGTWPRTTCRPGPRPPGTHPTVTAVELTGGTVRVHEGEVAFDVPLTDGWTTVADPPLAASATTSPDGRLVVDLAFVQTPHRLELIVDPAAGTFHATWPTVPLFGAGIARPLRSLRAPED